MISPSKILICIIIFLYCLPSRLYPQNRTNWDVWLVHFADCFCVRCLKAQIVGWFYSVYLWEINIFVKTGFLDIQPWQPCSSDMSGDLIHAHGHNASSSSPYKSSCWRRRDSSLKIHSFASLTRFSLPLIICYPNCGKFLHLATNFLNNNNSDCAGWIFLFADKHG